MGIDCLGLTVVDIVDGRTFTNLFFLTFLNKFWPSLTSLINVSVDADLLLTSDIIGLAESRFYKEIIFTTSWSYQLYYCVIAMSHRNSISQSFN